MRKSAKGFAVFLLGVGIISFAWAQLPPNVAFKWWNSPRIIKELGLTPQQVHKIETIWNENRKNLIGLRAEHDKLQVDMDELVSRPAADEAALRSMVDQLFRAKAEVEKATLIMRLRIRDVLTPEQQERSRALFEQTRIEMLEKRNAGEAADPPGGQRVPRPRNPLRVPPSTIPPQNAPSPLW
jgi:Spy/CpxP family protein refolding chaperone